jgi:hypothetical protein
LSRNKSEYQCRKGKKVRMSVQEKKRHNKLDTTKKQAAHPIKSLAL